MNKKKWALLILCLLLVFAWIKLFYKNYSVNAVVKNADCIVAIDVKKITNTLIWHFITTPSQWKISSSSSKTREEVNWKDMIEMPDYIFPFHVRNQPVDQWFVALKIKNENDFNKGLSYYHFEKLGTNEYASNDVGIHFFKDGKTILVTKRTADPTNYLASIADELFTKKSFIEKDKLEKVVDAKSHVAVWFAANSFLQEDAVIKASFDKEKIQITSTLLPAKQYGFTENTFLYSPNSLFVAGFTQPSLTVYNLLGDSAKGRISKAVGFNIDSLLRPDNKYYTLDIESVKSRVDSAITYSYDDDFNKVEKMVVNNVEEPAFNFFVSGDSAKNFYTYCLQNNKIDQSDMKQIFTGIPFVKSYFDTSVFKGLNITSVNYVSSKTESKFAGVLFLHLSLSKIPADLLKYLPGDLSNTLSNIENIHLEAIKKEEQLNINFSMQKKNNALPIIKL